MASLTQTNVFHADSKVNILNLIKIALCVLGSVYFLLDWTSVPYSSSGFANNF
jgi:hypothetical protein